MEQVILIVAGASLAWAFCFAWGERARVASNERIEMARMADKKATDELFERLRKVEKLTTEHEHQAAKLQSQIEILRSQNVKPARPITGLRS